MWKYGVAPERHVTQPLSRTFAVDYGQFGSFHPLLDSHIIS